MLRALEVTGATAPLPTPGLSLERRPVKFNTVQPANPHDIHSAAGLSNTHTFIH